MSEKEKNQSINELGEFGLIEAIKGDFTDFQNNTINGIGDDCAEIEKNKDTITLISTDTFNEHIHFDLRYCPLKHLGYKSVSASISDIAAMNGIPKQILINLSLSSRLTVEGVKELYKGIKLACDSFKVDLVGGDTTATPGGISISVTAIGEVNKKKISRRSGAKKGDLICVTGDFGAAYLGLQLLEREKEVFLEHDEMQPELKGNEFILGRQLKPEARMDAIYELDDLKIVPTSMIDVSDGLASELKHICKQSGVGAQVYEAKIPIAEEVYQTAINVFKVDPIVCALNGGEDYELLFTIPQEEFEKVEKHHDISVIGFITEESTGVNLITKANNVKEIKAQGWDHFDKSKEK